MRVNEEAQSWGVTNSGDSDQNIDMFRGNIGVTHKEFGSLQEGD